MNAIAMARDLWRVVAQVLEAHDPGRAGLAADAVLVQGGALPDTGRSVT